MSKTAVEWLIDEYFGGIENCTPVFRMKIQKAKKMEKSQSHEYATFAIRCSEKGMKILAFEDYMKLETFKSEKNG